MDNFKIKITKEAIFKTIWRTAVITFGSLISAAGMAFFIQPHKLITGGVTGTSLLLSYFTPIDPGIYIICINIPLFVLAWRKIDFDFCFYSIVGVGMLSLAMIILNNVTPNLMLVKDPLLSAIFGGMLSGGGTGIVLRSRGSQGGTDILSVIIRRNYSTSLGMANFYFNLVIVAILTLKFGIELGLLTLFSQYISARAIDRVVAGFNTAKAITIVSDHADEIAEYIMKKIYRGVTFLDGSGGYGGRHKKVIWCVVTTSQLSRVKAIMKKIDPEGFMSIMNASEIVGKGFYRSPF